MGYLISKIIICLLLAFLLGLILGWLLRNLACRGREHAFTSESEMQKDIIKSFEGEHDKIKTRLRSMERDNVELNAQILSFASKGESFADDSEQIGSNFIDFSTDLKPLEHRSNNVSNPPELNLDTDKTSPLAINGDSLGKEFSEDTGSLTDEFDRLVAAFDDSEEAINSLADMAPNEIEHPLQERNPITEKQDPLSADKTHIFKENDLSEQKTDPDNENTADVATNSNKDVDDTISNLDDYEIEAIECIGSGYAARLRKMGITTTQKLLEKSTDPASITEIAKSIDNEEFVVRSWISKADLIRVPGIRSQFAELLTATEITSVQQLARGNSIALTARMIEINARENLSSTNPSAEMVSDWISAAKELPIIIKTGD
jgi:predicted flap endonuclease-1-like 5' DNA nuclease